LSQHLSNSINNRPATSGPALFELVSPFITEYGTIRLLEPADACAETLSRQLLDGSYPKPFILDDGQLRSLYFNLRFTQSIMRLEAPDALDLPYTQTMMACLLFNARPQRMALLGLGGGSLAKFCYRQLPAAQIEVVEIDPHVIALREQFLIPGDDHRFRVLQDDGAAYLKNGAHSIDVLLVDAFDRDGLSASLAGRTFLLTIRDRLAADGILVMNLAGEKRLYVDLIDEAMEIFDDRIIVASVDDDGNHLLFAFKNAYFEPRWRQLANQAKELKANFGLDFPGFVQLLERSAKLNIARRLQTLGRRS